MIFKMILQMFDDTSDDNDDNGVNGDNDDNDKDNHDDDNDDAIPDGIEWWDLRCIVAVK